MALAPLPGATLIGSTTPRLFTEPLVELTPDTSLGFEAIRFANTVLGIELIPWQEWWLIHALELNHHNQLRFKRIITLLPRQNGKTELLSILSLYFMFSERAKLVLGTAQALDIAREAWTKSVDHAEASDITRPEIADVRKANGEQCLTLRNKARYRIAATTRGAGRGLSVDLLILDELREHRDWNSWAALSATTTARPESLIVGISNAGDMNSVVLNTLRGSALSGDEQTLGLFEWSAPDGCELDDRDGWQAANPSLGYVITEDTLRGALATSTPSVFRTEHLCQTVESLDNAIDLQAWKNSGDPGVSLEPYRDELVLGLDVSYEGSHVSLIGAAEVSTGRYRVGTVAHWQTVDDARKELPGVLAKLPNARLCWSPSGPAAVLAPELRDRDAIEVKGSEVSESCQGFADLVLSGRIQHDGDALLSAHVSQASKFNSGEGWRFARKGGIGEVDAAYSAAFAVYVLRTQPIETPAPRPFVI